jgi:transposase
MRAYSIDLRQKILDTYQSGGISQHPLSKHFRVVLSCIEKLLKQRQFILENKLKPGSRMQGATLIYLPPYSPDFSPIENCWSKINPLLY